MAQLIRTVMSDFGAIGPGFSINDPEVAQMAEFSDKARTQYFVVVREDRIVGSGGYAPLRGAALDVCELQKMYFYPEARGIGLGRRLGQLILSAAYGVGFRTCYIETMKTMVAAQRLYERMGFRPVVTPMGGTGHCGCDTYLIRALTSADQDTSVPTLP